MSERSLANPVESLTFSAAPLVISGEKKSATAALLIQLLMVAVAFLRHYRSLGSRA